MLKYHFYIARCLDKTLYVGSTDNIDKRIIRHNTGQGSKWIKQHGTAEIIYAEDYNTLLEVRRRERQVKKWSRVKKENLISGKWGKLK
ncbi:MAG: putative endonuclease [Parcubacteria group bacterium Gr01-1014_30]|nr:MAG: putative endonuclease [Parcubacteria group bacterium Gr01-1014_30]